LIKWERAGAYAIKSDRFHIATTIHGGKEKFTVFQNDGTILKIFESSEKAKEYCEEL